MKVSELLSEGGKWCKGDYAKDSVGNKTHWNSKGACRWCVLGALKKCYYLSMDAYLRAHARLKAIISEKYGMDWLGDWNDKADTTFDRVREVILEADV